MTERIILELKSKVITKEIDKENLEKNNFLENNKELKTIFKDIELTLQSLNYTKKEIKNLFPKLINDINNNKNSTLVKNTISFENLLKKAIDIGCTAIMISNHGGRQLDGSRSPFDQVKAIRDAVGDKLEVILDGGVRRGTHVLKALAAGATACSFGKAFLFSLGAGGQQGIERLLQNMHDEIRRNMILMGCKSIKDLDESKIIFRK